MGLGLSRILIKKAEINRLSSAVSVSCWGGSVKQTLQLLRCPTDCVHSNSRRVQPRAIQKKDSILIFLWNW